MLEETQATLDDMITNMTVRADRTDANALMELLCFSFFEMEISQEQHTLFVSDRSVRENNLLLAMFAPQQGAPAGCYSIFFLPIFTLLVIVYMFLLQSLVVLLCALFHQ